MTDLIYCGFDDYDDCKQELLSEWPEAEIHDASDDIHGGRFEIVVEAEKDTFWTFLLVHGYFGISLGLQFLLLQDVAYLKRLAVDAGILTENGMP